MIQFEAIFFSSMYLLFNLIFWESRVETRESGKGNPRKCWDFHFNGILVILIIG